jgi:hypothetical protein
MINDDEEGDGRNVNVKLFLFLIQNLAMKA